MLLGNITISGYVLPDPIRESVPKTVAGYVLPDPIRECISTTFAV